MAGENELNLDASINLNMGNFEEFASEIGQSISKGINISMATLGATTNINMAGGTPMVSNPALVANVAYQYANPTEGVVQPATQAKLGQATETFVESVGVFQASMKQIQEAVLKLESVGISNPTSNQINAVALQMNIDKATTVPTSMKEMAVDSRLTEENISAMVEKYKGLSLGNENIVRSFWSVWSISWAIRGILGDIFGYSSKWVAETTKLTRAFQSGLYLYSGTERIIHGISDQILATNVHQVAANALQFALVGINTQILGEKNTINALTAGGMILNEEDVAIHERKLVILIAQGNQIKEVIALDKARAMEETAGQRASLLATGKTLAIWAAVVVAVIGIIRWIQDMNDQINKGRASMRELAKEISASQDPLNTLKTSFSDIDSLINKIIQAFPEMQARFDKLTDPIEKYGLALALIAENAMPAVSMTSWGGMGDAISEAERYHKALQNLFTPLAEDTQKQGLLNAIIAANNTAIKANLETVQQLTDAYNKYGDAIARGIAKPITEKELNKVDAAIAEVKSKIENANLVLLRVPEASEIKKYIDELENQLKNLEKSEYWIAYQNYWVAKGYVAAGSEAAKTAVTGTTTTPMTMIEFYTKMYDAYNSAAEKNSKYTQDATRYKNLLVNALNAEIKALGQQISILDRTSEKYKELSVQRATDIKQLEDLINLQEKLNSTWFNIPSAIIKPTQSQLTGATIYLNPNISIKASGIDEIVNIAKDEIAKVIYNNLNLQKGNVGSFP